MSDVAGLEGGDASAPAAPHDVTAGALLRQAREAVGLHVAALAVALKVPVRKLEALEADRVDLLPDTVFARALAASVCRVLKVDAQPVLDRLPQTLAPRLVRDSDGINAPFRGSGDTVGQGWRARMSKPVVLAVTALLLGAVALILLPAAGRDESATSPKPDLAAAPVTPVLLAEPDSTPVPPPTPMPSLAQTSTMTMPVASNSASEVQIQPAAAGVVVFRARGPSWVEVTDARGAVAMRRLLAPGEAAGVSGALPLQVTVGSAGTTDVQVRGVAFDLGPVSRDNVARFEVK